MSETLMKCGCVAQGTVTRIKGAPVEPPRPAYTDAMNKLDVAVRNEIEAQETIADLVIALSNVVSARSAETIKAARDLLDRPDCQEALRAVARGKVSRATPGTGAPDLGHPDPFSPDYEGH